MPWDNGVPHQTYRSESPGHYKSYSMQDGTYVKVHQGLRAQGRAPCEGHAEPKKDKRRRADGKSPRLATGAGGMIDRPRFHSFQVSPLDF